MGTRLEAPEGGVYNLPDEQVSAAVARGWKPVENAATFETTAPKDTSVTGAISAGLSSAASTATGGLSDVGLRLLGSKGDVEQDRKLRSDHSTAALVGGLAGAVIPTGITAGVGRLGAGLAERAGGGLLGAAAGMAGEGAIYGAGAGVSELALSDQPITAERIAQTLGSNVLLGGATGGVLGVGGKLVERGLARAADRLAEATATRSAIEGVPADLVSLDEKGLTEAMKVAKTEHAADIAAERQSLESMRVDQRAEMANQVRDLHESLATERPIFSALTKADQSTLNPALKGIEGVQDAQVQLAKSYKALRGKFDNMLSVESNPDQLIAPLQQRQGALETLQSKLPEIHAALAGDAKAQQLVHISGALEDTKAQIDAIRSLNSRANPVTGERLSMLESGPSQRMQAIDAAREALKKAPELGLVGKGATAAAFAGGTALAHMIPGVGIAAPFLGKGAADAVGSLFKRLAGAHSEIVTKTSEAAQRLLTSGSRIAGKASEIAPRAATATAALANVAFGPDNGKPAKSLPELYAKRSEELRRQTEYAPDGSVQMRPDARQALAAKLDPVRTVNPLLADKLETVAARRTAYLSGKLPRRPQVGSLQVGPDTWTPSSLEIRSFARSVRGAEDPGGVEERLAHGIITPEEAEAYRTVYPERYADLQATIFRLAPVLSKSLPTNKRVALSVFTGVPCMPAMEPNVMAVLQGAHADEKGSAGGTQAPAAQPNFGALGSLKDMDKPTASQQRSENL